MQQNTMIAIYITIHQNKRWIAVPESLLALKSASLRKIITLMKTYKASAGAV